MGYQLRGQRYKIVAKNNLKNMFLPQYTLMSELDSVQFGAESLFLNKICYLANF